MCLSNQAFPKKFPLWARSFSLVGPVGFEPTTNQLCLPLQLSLPLSNLWSGLSLYPEGYLPYSLYTFPYKRTWLGIASLWSRGFPEFDRC